MVGSVCDVVVDELAHLHDQDGVVGVRLVVALTKCITHHSGRGQLNIPDITLPWEVQGTRGILRQQNSLIWCSRPAKVWFSEVIAGSIKGSVLHIWITCRGWDPRTSFLDGITCVAVEI